MLGVISRERTSFANSNAVSAASCSSAPGRGSCTNMTSASLPYPHSPPPSRPREMTANRVGSVDPAPASTRRAETERTDACSAPVTVAAATSDRAAPTCSIDSIPSTSAAAIRKSSRRLIPRTVRTASTGSSCLSTAEKPSLTRAARLRGMRSSSCASRPTASGERIRRSVASLLEPSSTASRWAATDSSRSNRRYQGVAPSASDTLRKPSSAASGSGVSANQPSRTGSSVRWMADRRVTPLVNASRCRSAPSGSTYPSASSRWWAASGVSRASPDSSRATAWRSGR
ncbi:unannotated protein [freshwater metagenome]|uniref:Unannotated protein n=1 Tax=freshwater metagenome TaxID=449393 RepID=A0A6J7JUN0_9ZZZZ